MEDYEKALILTSTMTNDELLHNEYVTYENEQQLLNNGDITYEDFIKRIRKKLYDHLKVENVLKGFSPRKYWNKLNIKETPFYLTDTYKKHFVLFKQHMQDFTCPVCNNKLIYHSNKGTCGCPNYSNCTFVMKRTLYEEVMKTV